MNEARSEHRFSIIVPCFNDGEFLERSLGSCIAQSRPADQIIVVDDGSTDGTTKICERYRREIGDRFIYHRQENAGVSAARNQGIRLASGDCLVFLDADDELLPRALEAYAEALGANVLWLIGGSCSERDGRIKTRALRLPKTRVQRFKRTITKRLVIGNISNMCFAASLFEDCQFDTSLPFGEDVTLWAILFTVTDPVVVREPTAVAHRRDDSLRTRASLQALVDSRVSQAIFEHPLLDPGFLKYRGAYSARNAKSIMKRAYREQRYADAVYWYEQMIKAKAMRAFDLKALSKYIRARVKTRGERSERAEP